MAPSDNNDRIKLATATAGLVAALMLAAWLLGLFERDNPTSDDPQVADILRAMEQPKQEDVKLLMEKYKQLNPEQQKEVGMRKVLMSLPKQEQKLRDFFAQPKEEQWKQIDREIDAKITKSKQTSADAKSSSNQATSKKSSGGSASPQQIMEMKKEWTANASPELRSMVERRLRMTKERREQRGL